MLTQQDKEKIRSDSRIRMRIALELGVTERTVLNWLNGQSKRLTAPGTLKIIKRLL
jgi:hypothetical protein